MNVYEIVTQRILEEMEKGRIPWRRPWRTEGPAINYVTRKEYRGINRLLLAGGEYLTYKQIQERGGKVKKGEKSSIVVFWKQLEIEDDDGEKKEIPILRYYRVFSIHQCEGIESKLESIEKSDVAPIEEAEKVFTSYVEREGVEVKHTDPNRACYYPDTDSINIPELAQYDYAEEYYSTAFHEAAHSTGHESRLARLTKVAAFGSASYSKEELVAEISAAYLCESCGLDADKTITNSAAYIQGWSEKLKKDPRLVVLAAGAAEKATEYILGDNTMPDPSDNKPGPGLKPEVKAEERKTEETSDAATTGALTPETAAAAIAAITGQPVSLEETIAASYVSLAQLKKALQQVKKAMPKKSGTDTWETVRGTLRGGILELAASSDISTLMIRIDAENAIKERVFYGDINTMTAAVNSAISERCEIVPGKDVISIDGMKIPARSADRFYEHCMKAEKTSAVALPEGELYKAINSIAHAMSTNMNKPVLHGINVELDGKALTFTALDGHRLATYAATAGKAEGAFNVTIPAEAVELIKSIKGRCGIVTDGKNIQVNSGGVFTLISRLYDGEYLHWRNIMPAEFKTSATVDASVLAQIAKNTIQKEFGVVTLSLGESVKVETFRDGLRSPLRTINGTTSGAELDITFNARYLYEALRGVSRDPATLQFNSAISPMQIKDGALTMLVLPVKTNK